MEEVDSFDYYSDQNGMVHCGNHIEKKAQYINIALISHVNDRLLCSECYHYYQQNSMKTDEDSYIDIDDIFDEGYQIVGFKYIQNQLEQLISLENVQLSYMSEMERFYDSIKRDVIEQIDQCKKKMLTLFGIQLDQQSIFKEELVQLLNFDSLRYFVRTMNDHSLQCSDIDLFIQEQYRLAQVLDEITQNYIYSPDMLAFFSQIEQLKKATKANRFSEVINDISLSSNCSKLISNNQNHQMANRELLQQLENLDAKMNPPLKRKDSLDMQLQTIERQKFRVMGIEQEQQEECDITFLSSIFEQSRHISLEKQQHQMLNALQQQLQPNNYNNVQIITIPPLLKCQIFSSSPLINSQTYEFNLEFLSIPSGDFIIGLVQESKKNQMIQPKLGQLIRRQQDEREQVNQDESLFSSVHHNSQSYQIKIRINISKSSLIIHNSNYKQKVQLQDIDNQTNYRLALQFSEQNSKLMFRLLGVNLIY